MPNKRFIQILNNDIDNIGPNSSLIQFIQCYSKFINPLLMEWPAGALNDIFCVGSIEIANKIISLKNKIYSVSWRWRYYCHN